jgi:DNA alkylation damage repair protein AlkB
MQLEPGLFLFQAFLDAAGQRRVWEECRALATGDVPMYTPTVRGGRKMSVGMLCLGRHWNALTYTYEDVRSDHDGLRVPPVPASFAAMASEAAGRAGMPFSPDLCIMNFYSIGSRMGVHQDKDESRASIERGAPIVSVSVGDAARFVIGGLTRRDAMRPLILRSGDVVVFGGPSRLRFHGVTRVLPGTAPEGTGPGRYNLTFREE